MYVLSGFWHLQDKLGSRPVTTLDGFYGTQQGVQGMVRNVMLSEFFIFLTDGLLLPFYSWFLQVQLNLMAPTRDNYYGNPPAIQGLVSHPAQL